MLRQITSTYFVCAVLLGSLAPLCNASGQIPDSVAHPIQTGCGGRLDPVGFLLSRAEELGLTTEQRRDLQLIGGELEDVNRPFGEQWWGLSGAEEQGELQRQRRAIMAGLKTNYSGAMEEIRRTLDEVQWEQALQPPDSQRDPRVRCLARSILAILGPGVENTVPSSDLSPIPWSD